MLKMRKVLTILLAVLFVATMTIGAASACDNNCRDHNEHHGFEDHRDHQNCFDNHFDHHKCFIKHHCEIHHCEDYC